LLDHRGLRWTRIARPLPIVDDIEFRDLLIDLRDLIGRGATNEEIAEHLKITDLRMVDQVRSRLDDFSSM
jgi:hypothetical protein